MKTRGLSITTVFLVLVSLTVAESSAGEVYRCTDSSGNLVFTNSPCTGKGDLMFRYKDGDPKPQSTASDADDAARSFGFENFADYQRAREICLGLLSQPLSPGINSCGNDMACMEQEAERLQRNMDSITSSNEWKRNKCDVVAEIEAEKDDDSYTIEISHNDEIFVINGETYEAKTYCFNMDEGDEVIFIDGSPYGACASAEVLNIRTKDRCELWCE